MFQSYWKVLNSINNESKLRKKILTINISLIELGSILKFNRLNLRR